MEGGSYRYGNNSNYRKRADEKDLPKFNVGDTVRVYVKVVEGTRERLQALKA